MIITSGKFTTQPQHNARIDKNGRLTTGLTAAFVFDSGNMTSERVGGALYPVTNAIVRPDKYGKVLYFDGTGDYVNTGVQTLGGVNLFADSTSKWSVVVCARLETSAASGSFVAKCGATGANRTFQLYRDASFSSADPAVWLRGGATANELNWDWNTADWHQYTVTWDGATAMAYGDYDRSSVLTVGTAAQEAENIVFGARTGGSAFLLTGRLAYGYFFNRAITRQESVELFQNPWQVFQVPEKEIWYSVSAPTGDGVGSSDGTSTVSGIGASDNAQPGSSSGTSTVSGVGASDASSIAASSGTSTVSGVGSAVVESVGSASGASTVDGVGASSTGGSVGSASGTSTVLGVGASSAASDGVANGVALVSGIGASTHAATGSADGIATVSGVGDSVQAGSSVGSASGSSTVSGVGASVVAAVGNASGDSTATGRGSSTGGVVESFSGGYPYISRESHAARKKKQRIELGIEEEDSPTLEQFEISNLVEKEPVLVPALKQLISARQQKKLEQEAIHAELKQLLQLEQEREEEEIVKLLMNF